jgi:hypothetical protein
LSSRVRPWSGRAATVFDPFSDLDQASGQLEGLFRVAIVKIDARSVSTIPLFPANQFRNTQNNNSPVIQRERTRVS